jgi:hypothetical protein
MIKDFVKYNESLENELILQKEYKLFDIWEKYINDNSDRLENILTFICKTFKNKILTFKTKKEGLIEKIKITEVEIRIILKNNLILNVNFIDENGKNYIPYGKENIIVWRKFNPIDPYSEEEWETN